MSLALAYIGHPILRGKCVPVHAINQEIGLLIEKMKRHVEEVRALGLAAPQVGVQLAFFVACVPVEIRDERMIVSPPKLFINPKIEDPSPDAWIADEACLSLPRLFAPVKRPCAVTISYQDEQLVWHKERYSGWDAKIVMHENDHLNGTLFIDRVAPNDKHTILKEIERLKKHYKGHNEHLPIWKVAL